MGGAKPALKLRWVAARAAAVALPMCVLAGAQAQDIAPDMLVTTDTPEYCADLARLVEMHAPLTPEVDHLWSEGRDMCSRGEVRGGILRLRRAVRILNYRSPSDPPE